MKKRFLFLFFVFSFLLYACSENTEEENNIEDILELTVDTSPDAGADIYVCNNQLDVSPIDIVDYKPFKKGPYIMYTDQTSTVIMWETDEVEPSIVEYGVDKENLYKVIGKESDLHEVRLEGLKAGTTYFYRVGNGNKMSEFFSFRTDPDNHLPFRFVAYSDSQNHPEIHSQLIPLIASEGPAFIIHAGDTVERGGEADRWQTELFDVIRPLAFYIPYYIAIGNHEANSEYFYRYVSYPYPEGEEQHESYYWFKYGSVFVIVIDSNKYLFGIEDPQHKWVINTLRRPEAIWAGLRIAVFHYSAYTDGWGSCDYDGSLPIRKNLLPVLEEGGVNLIINGHTHGYERGFLNGVYHMIVGGGGGDLDHKCNDFPFVQKTEYIHHFVKFDVMCDSVQVDAIDIDGRVFDSFDIPFKYPEPSR